MLIFLLILCTSYLLGSIPFGLVLMKLAGRGDIRAMGSGNIGTTNVLRTGSKTLAVLTLLADSGKGALAVWLCSLLSAETLLTINNLSFLSLEIIPYCAGLAVFLGHIFPVWLKFKGGKGVATALGIYVVLNPLAGLLTLLGWLVTAKIFRISSLSALVSFTLCALVCPFFTGMPFALYSAVTALIIAWTHRTNIARLLSGTESAFK